MGRRFYHVFSYHGTFRKFNSLPPESMSERSALLKEVFGSVEEKDNVWIGANVVVLPGVTIGENSVIGAGSIVTKDILANVIAFGSPCKVYREINEHDEEFYFKDRRFDGQPE